LFRVSLPEPEPLGELGETRAGEHGSAQQVAPGSDALRLMRATQGSVGVAEDAGPSERDVLLGVATAFVTSVSDTSATTEIATLLAAREVAPAVVLG
jgi:hypothetical protein